MNFFTNVFEVFCLLSRNILANTKKVAAPASSEPKHVSGKHCIQQPAKITQLHSLIHINVFNIFTFHGSSHQHLFVKESFTVKKPLTKNFLLNTHFWGTVLCAWLLLASKFYSEFDSVLLRLFIHQTMKKLLVFHNNALWNSCLITF